MKMNSLEIHLESSKSLLLKFLHNIFEVIGDWCIINIVYMAGGRKKSSKLAAQSAAISAVGGSMNGHGDDDEGKPIIQQPRTILGVLLISFFSFWFVANSNQTLPVSNFNTTELFNLSNYDINLSSSNEMLKTAYNEFYADTVQVSLKCMWDNYSRSVIH